MPEFKVRTPDGKYFNVTVPPGTTKEQALEYAKSQKVPDQGILDPAPTINAPGTEPGGIYDRLTKGVPGSMSPKGFWGPGLVAHASSKLQGLVKSNPETPQQNYDRTVPALETIVDVLGTLAGPSKTFLQRMGTGVGVPMGLKILGGTPGDMVEGGLKGGAQQGIAEILSGIVKAKRLGSLANTARAEFEKKMATQTSKVATDRAMLKTLEDMDKTNYDKLVGKLEEEHKTLSDRLSSEFQTKVSSHENLLAGTIMDDTKKSVPAWKDLPSTIEGLYTAVLGKGKELLSENFDKALQAAKGSAAGKTVDIPVADQGRLGVSIKGERKTPTDSNDLRLLVPVDAAELIDALPGLKDKALKARSHDALAQADLNIAPEAMKEYSVGKGTIDLIDKNNVFKFDETTNKYSVDRVALAKGLLDRDKMDIIQNRGMGDFDTYPGLQTAKSGPTPPEIPPLTLPEPPPMRGPLGNPEPIPAPDISEITLPGNPYRRSHVGGALGALLGGLVGAGGHGATGGALGGVGGYAVGKGLGAVLPDKIVTKAPMSPLEEMLQSMGPAALGAVIKAVTPDIGGVSAEDLAEIRAAQAQGQTAQENPALQLGLDPSETR